MKVTNQDVLHVASLANLELTDKERERMLRDLNSILDYIDRLNELDTTKVPPMAQTLTKIRAESEKPAEPLRNDELRPSLQHENAVKNAPDTDGSFFKVPKVVEK